MPRLRELPDSDVTKSFEGGCTRSEVRPSPDSELTPKGYFQTTAFNYALLPYGYPDVGLYWSLPLGPIKSNLAQDQFSLRWTWNFAAALRVRGMLAMTIPSNSVSTPSPIETNRAGLRPAVGSKHVVTLKRRKRLRSCIWRKNGPNSQ